MPAPANGGGAGRGRGGGGGPFRELEGPTVSQATPTLIRLTLSRRRGSRRRVLIGEPLPCWLGARAVGFDPLLLRAAKEGTLGPPRLTWRRVYA